jgi:DNA-binding GntR family transcriptional regulator
VADILRAEILDGRLPVGARLHETRLARRLTVSRTPVREAIQRLVSEGLVIRDEVGAASVYRLTVADLTEIYEMRVLLETRAATLAVQRSTPAFASSMWSRLEELTNSQPGQQSSRSHSQLHMGLYENCGRPRLVALVGLLRAQSEPYVRLATQMNDDFARIAHAEHVQMVEMVTMGDVEGIDKVIREHLRVTLDRAPKILGLR